MSGQPVLRIAVPTPAPGCFDYLLPLEPSPQPRPGVRVRVSFGRRTLVGVVVDIAAAPAPHGKLLKRVLEVLDDEPIMDSRLVDLLRWTSGYYQHPIGEVMSTALPQRLRAGKAVALPGITCWMKAARCGSSTDSTFERAPRQRRLLALLEQHPEGLTAPTLDARDPNWRQAMRALVAKGFVVTHSDACLPIAATAPQQGPTLNQDQCDAVEEILSARDAYACWLLAGVTGSGKTEVYFSVIDEMIANNLQTLILVPEISLTPQLVDRVQRRFTTPVAVLHSALSDSERHRAWWMAREGVAPVVIGTRSAVFVPLERPGIIIVDEEHDTSFKQQEGFRYHARDVAVYRARQLDIPIVMGSATPSLESLHNVAGDRYRHLVLAQRAGAAQSPRLEVVDVRRRELKDGLSDQLLNEIARHLDRGNQVLLFLNRRGFAPTLLCHGCGWAAICTRCDTHMTYHAGRQKLCCHHCGAERTVVLACPGCGADELQILGTGTERLEHALERRFPGASLVRIDRDTTRRKGSMAEKLEQIRQGTHQILVGTQMLSKGHDFPNVTLVGIVDVDRGIFSADFRALERIAQLIVQVAGRAGRGATPGTVMLQTHQPDHPLLRILTTGGYDQFGRATLEQRRLAELPPYSHMALLRAEAIDERASGEFLTRARRALEALHSEGIKVLGPAPAPMERRAGRYRAHLLLIARQRKVLQTALQKWAAGLHLLPGARKVRWSLDVDPVELF
ncbi:MAG: primosomal protein N' [Gammaproteobacteria bacterium]